MPSITVWLLQGVIFLYVAIVYGKYDIIEGRGKRIYGLINGTRYLTFRNHYFTCNVTL